MARLSDLPEEVLAEIMSLLPPESLIQFKGVCKSWYVHINDLINEPVFVAKHLRNAKNNLSSSPLLHLKNLFIPFTSPRRTFWLTLANCDSDLHDTIPCLSQDVEFHTRRLYDKDFQLVSHYNGIICFSSYGKVILMNPALRELKIVPKSSFAEGCLVVGVGFGYNFRANDYKVVTIEYKKNLTGGFYKAEVYSLSTNSSKEIKLDAWIFSVPTFEYQSVYCNGVCYWYCYNYFVGTIISFDVGEEIFHRVPFPNNALNENRSSSLPKKGLKIAAWNESIAFFCYTEVHPLRIDVWVMDARSGGVEGSYSWTRHLTVGPLFGIKQPVAFWGDKELFMMTNDVRFLSSSARPRSEFTGIGAVIEIVTVREVQACLVKSLVFPIYSRILSPLEKA
ncbi:hypothetical protein TIFTF001_044636 [Ficus carica]|uniref:F-box domain-containing protein n=1 Tax=Ficus carica TaxID=3494 RepID=A0AA88CVI2_FICCA|nr:hypothetical protein TIFTF001_044636 [Ficus carica]